MIYIKSPKQIELMRKAGVIVRDTLNLIEDNAKVGVTTKQLDKIAYDYIRKQDAIPGFLNYNGFPASLCTSIDEEVVHGIPSERVLEEGMILKVDTGAVFMGLNSDAARTFAIGKIDKEKLRLMRVVKESFFKGIAILKEGVRLGDLGFTIQKYVESEGFSVVRSLVGHGIGEKLHEDPNVPNFGQKGRGTRVSANMTLAIEPMINQGTYEVEVALDNWTVVTKDKKPSAHYENTVLITNDGVEILTL